MNTKDIAGLAKFVAPSRTDSIPDSLKASSAGEKAEKAAMAELEAQEDNNAEPQNQKNQQNQQNQQNQKVRNKNELEQTHKKQ